MEYDYLGYVYYLISLPKIININTNYKYRLEDDFLSVIEINVYQNSLEFGDFYYQDSLNNLYVFMKNGVNDFLISNPTSNTSNFYLVSYNYYDVENIYSENVFVQKLKIK